MSKTIVNVPITPAAPKMKFRIIGGPHVHDDGRVYGKGDIIESFHDLRKTWREKFERVDSLDTPAGVVAKGVPLEGNSDTEPPATPAPATETQTKPPVDDEVDNPATDGTDVTDRFPTADENEFKVFKFGGSYSVYDAADLNSPINKTGVNKAAVAGVISSALEKKA